MSKAEKVEISIEDAKAPVLEALDVPALFNKMAEIKKAKTKLDLQEASIKSQLQIAAEAVGADSLLWTPVEGKDPFRATVVAATPPGKKTDEDLLKTNMGKIGKLDAALIKKIFDKSQKDTKGRSSYVTVKVPDLS